MTIETNNYDEPIPENVREVIEYETKEEVEKRFMKVIRKLYSQLELKEAEISNLKDRIEDLKERIEDDNCFEDNDY
jgi:hypothetical protein